MGISSDIFKQSLSQFATGVTIATTQHNNQPLGLTISSLSSVSLTPPLILFCLNKASDLHTPFSTSKHFAIHILSEKQQELASRFASPIEHRFEGIAYNTGSLGSPILPNCVCTLECKTNTIYDGGDHSIFIGEVIDASHDTKQSPLLYFRGKYNRLD